MRKCYSNCCQSVWANEGEEVGGQCVGGEAERRGARRARGSWGNRADGRGGRGGVTYFLVLLLLCDAGLGTRVTFLYNLLVEDELVHGQVVGTRTAFARVQVTAVLRHAVLDGARHVAGDGVGV